MNKRFQEAVWLSVRCVPLLTLLGAVPWMLMKWYAQMPDLLMQAMQGAGTVLPWPAMVIDAQQLVAVILQDSGYVAMLALCWITRTAFPALLPRLRHLDAATPDTPLDAHGITAVVPQRAHHRRVVHALPKPVAGPAF